MQSGAKDYAFMLSRLLDDPVAIAAIAKQQTIHHNFLTYFDVPPSMSLRWDPLADEPAWTRFKDAVLEFSGRAPAIEVEDPRLAALTTREREILGAVVAGKTNAEIGATLFISEKTARNLLARIFEKLGGYTRTQAALLAQDRGWNLAVPPGHKMSATDDVTS